MGSLNSFNYFQVLQPLYQSFADWTKSTNYNSYNRHFHVPQFFQFPSKIEVLIFLFVFFQFYSVVSRGSKRCKYASSFLFIYFFIITSDLQYNHKANLVSCTQRVSGELGISQSSVTHQLHDLCKSFWNYWIVPHILPKYCKTFDSTNT